MALRTPDPHSSPMVAAPPSVSGPVSTAPLSLATGAVVDRYRVLRALGEGAMGAVYQVEHVHMKKLFALKVLHPSTCAHPEIVARFEREAHAAGQIDHPNVAAATDFGKLPNGSFFLVLEYAEGQTLRDELVNGALTPRRALGLLHAVLSGVAAAHAKGIVHRDLKPENIMLSPREGNPDAVKVLDFGIAKVGHVESDSPKSSGVQALTRVGTVMGTPEYMAPEQALGGDTDVRSDLYSLGVILYEMLVGTVPFLGEPVVILKQHVASPVPHLPAEVSQTVGPDVAALVHRLMAKEPSDRVQTAQELLTLVDEALRGMDRQSQGSAQTMLGVVSSPDLQGPNETALTRRGPTVFARAETWIAHNDHYLPTPIRGKLSPRVLLAIVAALAGFLMLIPLAVVIGVATSGGSPDAETPEESIARSAGVAAAEPHVVSRAASPSAAKSASPATAVSAAASAAATVKPAATARATAQPKKPSGQPTQQPRGTSINIPPPSEWFK